MWTTKVNDGNKTTSVELRAVKREGEKFSYGIRFANFCYSTKKCGIYDKYNGWTMNNKSTVGNYHYWQYLENEILLGGPDKCCAG